MVIKTTKKTTTKPVKKITKKEQTLETILKEVTTVSDSNKILQMEIKSMSKIFGENQEVLISMKGMIDILTSTLKHIQEQSKQINTIEEDTKTLFTGLSQIKMQENIVDKINNQTEKLEKEIKEISELQKTYRPQETSQQIEDNVNSIRNNSQMIIKIAQRIDQIRDDLREVSGKTNYFSEIGSEIDNLKRSIEEISGKTSKLGTQSEIVTSLKNEFERITKEVSHASSINEELDTLRITIDKISSKASKIDSLTGSIEEINKQFDSVSSKANSADNHNRKSIKEIGVKIDRIETEIGSLVQESKITTATQKGLKSMQNDMSVLKQGIFDKTNIIEEKIITISDELKKQDKSMSKFHKKSEMMLEGIQQVKNHTSEASDNSSKEIMALLKLSEYQSKIRMCSESKYGESKDLEKMSSQTTDIINLFDSISDEVGEKIPLPHEVRQWAIGKILDCADKWEIKFGDVYSILCNTIGKDMLKESIRIQQIRDIYGIRAVDEIRKELNIS